MRDKGLVGLFITFIQSSNHIPEAGSLKLITLPQLLDALIEDLIAGLSASIMPMHARRRPASPSLTPTRFRVTNAPAGERAENSGILLASGLIAGESLMGVLVALLVVAGVLAR